MAAVNADPLSETPHAALMRVYMIQGSRAEALAVFERYRIMLDEELGLEPTRYLQELTKDQNALPLNK